MENKESVDWRLLRDQIKYLYGVGLVYHTYTPSNSNNDHDHCEFCMQKFGYGKTDLHQGYSTEDNYTWICKNCFNDFNEKFNWIVINHLK